VLCREERYIRNFYLKGPDRSVKSGEALYPGSAFSKKKTTTYIALMGFAEGTEGKERYIRGALYPSSTVFASEDFLKW